MWLRKNFLFTTDKQRKKFQTIADLVASIGMQDVRQNCTQSVAMSITKRKRTSPLIIRS